ncbi:E3 ubiquitin-protein ligase WAV3-like [Tasmannia lanceolata]|uniref:E3 ubiquitin-protein ligase WAV3-like n=1 Tax=Tasmannia lanceolata TaxID=3420 RepID=UPI004063644A
MGSVWRRAFCTSVRGDPEIEEEKQQTPSLRCRTTGSPAMAHDSPSLHFKTTKSPRLFQGSNPCSPKSPSRFALFKSSLGLSKSNCGICLERVKMGQGTAIFTAECSHAFHFPCIADYIKKEKTLVCPVCHFCWQEVPLLSIHKHKKPIEEQNPEIENQEQAKMKEIKTGETRFYDDDEPLLSPTGRFNPIPEENEEEIQEFQGFNPVNQSVPLKSEDKINGGDLMKVSARLLPEAAVVSVGRSHESFAVALRVRAPNVIGLVRLLDPARRAPIDLVTVLDLSVPIDMLKHAMRLVISALGSADRLSIVAFSASAKRLLQLRRMSAQGRLTARRIIDRLGSSQGSCVTHALKKATKVLEDRRERNPGASIMLLSDGQDEKVSNNQNNLRHPSSHVPWTRFVHLEIPIHEDEDKFAKFFSGLLSVFVQDLRLQLRFSSGEISAVYYWNGRPTNIGSSSNSIRLGDLYADEERELLVELRVPMGSIGAHHVLGVKCSYKDLTTQELVHCKDQALLVPRPHAVRTSAPRIERLRNLFVTFKAIAEARRLAEEKNDLGSAHRLLYSARALLLHSSSISADENLSCLEAELAELDLRRQDQIQRRGNDVGFEDKEEPLTPMSAWRVAEQLAKVAIMRKSLNRVSDLHGFENARF